MTPEEKQLLLDLQDKVDKLTDVYFRQHYIDRDVFSNPVFMENDVSFKTKVGFYKKVPISQQSAISAPTGGDPIDTEARTAINSIRAVLTAFGFTA